METSIESSIEITKDKAIYCDVLSPDAVNIFLFMFALTAEKKAYNYTKMNKGMVNYNKSDVVISFGIKITGAGVCIKNLLSSLDFEDTKKFIASIYGFLIM